MHSHRALVPPRSESQVLPRPALEEAGARRTPRESGPRSKRSGGVIYLRYLGLPSMTLAACACALSIADVLIAAVSVSLLAFMEREEKSGEVVLFHTW